MILSSVFGLFANLAVSCSGYNNGNVTSISDYINYYDYQNNDISEVNYYTEMSNTLANFTMVFPVTWDTNSNVNYIMFYYRTGSNQDPVDTFMFGFGHNTNWANHTIQYYVNSEQYDYVANIEVSTTFFNNAYAPFSSIEGENNLQAVSDYYGTWQRKSNGGYTYTSETPDIRNNMFDDIRVGFNTVISISVNVTNESYNYYYNEGYQSGYADGSSAGYQTGYDTGYTEGYSTGKQAGIIEGQNQTNTSVYSLAGAIIDTPIMFLRSLFDYELFGISIYVAILSMITLVIAIWVVRKFI